jgi:predicted O-methyltransferase YrrM
LGKVDFVDAGYGEGHPDNWGGVGFWKRKSAKNHFGVLGLTDWISVHVMTSEDFSYMGTKRSWNYIYIDADHSYKGIKKDFDIFWPRLEKGGLMLFHDVLIQPGTDGMGYGARKFWNELGSKNKITAPFTIEWGIPSGLGILQKP